MSQPRLRSGASHLDVHDFKIVRAIAHQGTVTRAAAQLNVTQSGLSRQLADLEHRVGAMLFLRRRQRMEPTAAGEVLLARGSGILDGIERAEADVRSLVVNPRPVLRIATECYTVYRWLSPILRSLRQNVPSIDIEFNPAASGSPTQALLGGEIDVALITGRPSSPAMRWTLLFRDELVALVACDHPWAARRHVQGQDFVDQHLIVLGAVHDSTVVREVLRPAGVTPARISSAPLTEAAITLAESGIGVAVLPRWTVAAELESGRLVAVSLGRPELIREWNVVHLAKRAQEPQLKAFLRLLAVMTTSHFTQPPEAPSLLVTRSSV